MNLALMPKGSRPDRTGTTPFPDSVPGRRRPPLRNDNRRDYFQASLRRERHSWRRARHPTRRRVGRQARAPLEGRKPLEAGDRQGCPLLLLLIAHVIGRRGGPAIMPAGSQRVMTHRAHSRTRRQSRLRCPSSGDGSARRRPDAGGCDRDRRGRDLPSLGVAGGPRRWAIRWAKPSRIGPYQARRRALTGANIWSVLQVFHRLEAPRTPCFTRERSQVRNPPRPFRPACIREPAPVRRSR
jgi:hypothetical protein